MKKTTLLFLGLAIIVTFLTAFKFLALNEEEKAIKTMIEKSYFNGAFNSYDTKSMAQGFHPDFAIYYAEGGDTLGKYPIKDWIAGIEKRKAAPTFDASKREWVGKFMSVDITGNSAMAKVELSKNNKLVYTDYLSLLKFESGWRIVGKVYHEHK
jgi:hypothetical protein